MNKLAIALEELSVSMEKATINIYDFFKMLKIYKTKLPRKLKKKMFGTRSSRRRGRF